jgi:excisionase family DNA binding protein
MEHSPVKIPLNTDQAAKYIGRSAGAVRNLVLRRKIPYRKVAGRLVFFQDELEKWWDEWPGVRLEDLQK